jgi:hypothetical protein
MIAFRTSAADIYGDGTPLFSCNVNGEERYGTSINDVPGQCTPLPSLRKEWILVSISNDGRRAFYVNLSSLKRNGNIIDLSMLLLKPNSNAGEYTDASSAQLFDLKMRKYFDCVKRTQWSDKVELYRNFRTRPILVKTFLGSGRDPKIIDDENSADGRALKFSCSKSALPN